MRKLVVKIFISSIILLFCNVPLQAQFIVFEAKGSVEVSKDKNVWNSLKKRDVVREPDFIRMIENSSMYIIDYKSFVYSYSNPDTITVGEIVNQRKKALDGMNEKSGNRKANARIKNSLGDSSVFFYTDGALYEDVVVFFKDMITSSQYDNSDSIPAGSVFFIAINNATNENIMVNVYQEDENNELTPCFPENIYLNRYTTVQFPDILFGKQENKNIRFVVNYSKQ
ncbi:MAG: hypothetical protein FWC34_06175 [Bacteroidetes bacterium]|nr:hypothetical protein [Bacteroidota bacterium]MCL2302980.1 hypothetical protein [Lentimicrobiaceae bacterium]